MKKKSGPALSLELPEYKTCPTCRGAGKYKPMFHEMPCPDCHGAGIVDKETSEAIEPEILIPVMKKCIHQLKRENAELKRNAEKQEWKGPYDDDLKKRNGGIYRGD